jgi:hypothetical protein
MYHPPSWTSWSINCQTPWRRGDSDSYPVREKCDCSSLWTSYNKIIIITNKLTWSWSGPRLSACSGGAFGKPLTKLPTHETLQKINITLVSGPCTSLVNWYYNQERNVSLINVVGYIYLWWLHMTFGDVLVTWRCPHAKCHSLVGIREVELGWIMNAERIVSLAAGVSGSWAGLDVCEWEHKEPKQVYNVVLLSISQDDRLMLMRVLYGYHIDITWVLCKYQLKSACCNFPEVLESDYCQQQHYCMSSFTEELRFIGFKILGENQGYVWGLQFHASDVDHAGSNHE